VAPRIDVNVSSSSRHQGVNGCISDNTLIQRYLHWQPDTTLREGLEKTYAEPSTLFESDSPRHDPPLEER
jgi:nucleoside-diphosphate-sugar epimerase